MLITTFIDLIQTMVVYRLAVWRKMETGYSGVLILWSTTHSWRTPLHKSHCTSSESTQYRRGIYTLSVYQATSVCMLSVLAADRWPGEAREPARKRNVSVVTVSRYALKPFHKTVVCAVLREDLSTYPEARSSKQIHEWSIKDPLKIPIPLQTLPLMLQNHDHISCGMLLINCNKLMISCIK